jgi:Na+/glutamate symporter
MTKLEEVRVVEKVTYTVMTAIISLFIIGGLMSLVLWDIIPLCIVIILSIFLIFKLLNLGYSVRIKHKEGLYL